MCYALATDGCFSLSQRLDYQSKTEIIERLELGKISHFKKSVVVLMVG